MEESRLWGSKLGGGWQATPSITKFLSLKAVELNDITYMVSPRKYDFIIICEWKHIVRGRVFHNVGKEGYRSSNIKDL